MHQDLVIRTERLVLRQWKDEDLEAFTSLNADPRVMEYFLSPLSYQESSQLLVRFKKKINEDGWGLWAASLQESGDFIGFIGLSVPTFEAHFTPAVEIGWRLAYPFWGKGYAKEGAKACLDYGFNTLHLEEIVSFTAIENRRSRKVMEAIGMRHDPRDDFDHPKVPNNHPLKRHVLYRINAKNESLVRS